MTCERTRTSLSAYLDGETSPLDVEALEAHLAACPDCARIERELREEDARLGALFAGERDAGAAIARRVEREIGGAPRILWPTLAAAAGFLLAVVLFGPWRDAAPPPSTTTATAAATSAERQKVATLLARLEGGDEKSEDELRGLAACSCSALADVALDAKEAAQRVEAARILADLAAPEDTPALIRLLSDDDPGVREHAARGIRRLTGRDFDFESCPEAEKDCRDWTTKHFGCDIKPPEGP